MPLAFCPHCGQPYPLGQEFCRNCGADLRQAPSTQAAPYGIPPVQPVKTPRSARNVLLVIAVVIVVVIIAVASSGFLAGLIGGSSKSRQTWQQYGMSIQYPAGVNTLYTGVLDQQADAASGEAEWLWNGANTLLDLAWVTTSNYNITAGLQGIYQKILAASSNVVIVDQGTLTMAGNTWQYQTYSYVHNGGSEYATYAVTYYTSSGRLYALGFTDTSDTTLASLQSYGSTFTG